MSIQLTFDSIGDLVQSLQVVCFLPGALRAQISPLKPDDSAEGKPIPTELRRDEQGLRKKIALEDDNTAVPRDHIDDEYARAEERDPKILLTTSRDPSSRLVQFAKEMKLVIPNAQRINRGGQVGLLKATVPAAQRIKGCHYSRVFGIPCPGYCDHA